DLLVTNEREAVMLGPDPAGLARRLRRGLVVTRGAAGGPRLLPRGRRLGGPGLSFGPGGTPGGGETVFGGPAAALNSGSSFEKALLRASTAAGLACLAHGAQTAIPDAAAIDAAMVRLPLIAPRLGKMP